jgi:hypothetical protein
MEKNKIKTCYVVNFWLGERRIEVDSYKENKLFFLQKQIDSLENLDNNIDTVIFNFNITPQHYFLVKDIFNIIPKKIKNSNIILNFRENYGMSYGAFSDIFKIYNNQFDYYIFNEDDYIFTQNNWDTYLTEKFNSIVNCGYLSMIVSDNNSNFPKHASHSTGISSYKVLSELINKYGELPHSKATSYPDNETKGQVSQTNSIFKLGYGLYDIRDDYRVLFMTHGQKIETYHSHNNQIFIKPAHLNE